MVGVSPTFLGRSGGMPPQENFEILGALRCILWPSEAVFNACLQIVNIIC